ncbi:hypothetical protein N7535_009088 [Penicillium sp. DV-2018c]|nr:hypothetical protein N7461_003016 [Penicillium sp. DV-2018c]KAJ5560891.1 hypothetical protein N7535_009088 [Penicillium sp. DV-2018c]
MMWRNVHDEPTHRREWNFQKKAPGADSGESEPKSGGAEAREKPEKEYGVPEQRRHPGAMCNTQKAIPEDIACRYIQLNNSRMLHAVTIYLRA